MTELIVNGQRVRVSEDFLSLSPEEQERTVEEIASSLPSQRDEPALSQLNLGIADAVGGLVDFINPFDTPAVSQALGLGDRLTTGSAREGLVSGMQTIGAAGEDRAPQGVLEAGLRGGGQAAGAAIPTGVAAQGLSRLPGVIGQASGQIGRSLATPGAFAAETAAGGAAGAAMEATERATESSDLPEWARDALIGVAGVAAPVGLAGGAVAGRAVASRTPGVRLARRGAEAVAATVAPYTRRGAQAVARRSVQDLAGSRERSLEFGDRIDPNNEFGLTPAQQIGEPEFLALEQMVARQPEARSQLDDRFADSMGLARGAVDDIGGDVSDAQRFFREARARTTTELRAVAQQAIRNAEARLSSISASRRPSENSRIVMEEVERAWQASRDRERDLWNAVPMTATVGTDRAREVAARILAETGDELQRDIPEAAIRRLLNEETAYLEPTSVRNLHALYSRLRQDAREASSGQAPNENRARIANAVADAILEDLGAVGERVTGEVGRTINEARAFSRSLHETFDRGAYGRLSRETIQGDTVVDPRVALNRSVGRGGAEAMVDAENLETAAAGLGTRSDPPQPNERARSAIVDYVRGRFADDAFRPNAQGVDVLDRAGAARFIRNNRELLERYPELRGEILEAGDQQRTADQVAATIAQRIEAIENARTNPVSGFADAAQETAIRSIVDAENPIRAAQAVLSAARQDETGAALDGIKAVFSDELIRRATRTQDGETFLDADAMLTLMQADRFRAAANRILDPDEMRRLERIIEVVQRLNQAQVTQPSLGRDSLSGARAPRLIEALIRIAAVRGAPTGGGSTGESLQIANMASSNARDLVRNLTADRASRMISEAILDEDGDGRLFQALLMDPASSNFEREALPRLIPYLVGGGAAATVEDEPPGPLRMELTDPGNRNQ